MRLNKKKLELVGMIEKCGYMFRGEIDKSRYPDSMIDALIENGLLAELKNKITSKTGVTSK